MRYWQLFWTVALLVAGASFVFITVTVAARGLQDLRQMFARLQEQKAPLGKGRSHRG